MAEQENESYEARVQRLVVDAIVNAGRAPDGTISAIDINEAIYGCCDAITALAVLTAATGAELEAAAQVVEAAEKQVSARLRHLAGQVRAGKFSPSGPDGPGPRLAN